jgi:ribosome recycling factor
VRNVRHKVHDDLRTQLKDHDITEDDNKRKQDQLQKMTDRSIKEIDQLIAAKEKEIMEV